PNSRMEIVAAMRRIRVGLTHTLIHTHTLQHTHTHTCFILTNTHTLYIYYSIPFHICCLNGFFSFTFSLYSLSNCSITEEGFSYFASALISNPSHIRELQLRGSKAGDSGVKHLSSLLEDPNCKLEKLE